MNIIKDKMELIEFFNRLAENKEYVFRGISKEEEKLPHILRYELASKELDMLKLTEKNAAYHLEATDYFGFVAQAQHYGLPTRLLDFTYNPFIALYFAMYSKIEDGHYTILYSKIAENILVDRLATPNIAQDYDYGNRSLTREFEISIMQAEKKYNSLAEKQDKKILFVDFSQSNLRLIMQQGLFMFPYTLDKDEHLRILNENTKEIKIDKSLRKELLEYLNTLGINAYRIMPDLASICQYIKKQFLEEKGGSI